MNRLFKYTCLLIFMLSSSNILHSQSIKSRFQVVYYTQNMICHFVITYNGYCSENDSFISWL